MTDIGYAHHLDYGGKRSSHDGSNMKKTRNSPARSMPFEYAADQNKCNHHDEVDDGDGVSSAGGGDPIETS